VSSLITLLKYNSKRKNEFFHTKAKNHFLYTQSVCCHENIKLRMFYASPCVRSVLRGNITRCTVVPDCFKDDNASRWKSAPSETPESIVT